MPPVRVDVIGAGRSARVRYARVDQPTNPLRPPLVLGPVARVAYADPKPEFTLRSILRNPMYLGLGFMLVMAFAMPKLMDSMDPEEMKALQEQMAKGGTMGALSGLLSGEVAAASDEKRALRSEASVAGPARKVD